MRSRRFFTRPGGKTHLTHPAVWRAATMTREALCDGQEEGGTGWARAEKTATNPLLDTLPDRRAMEGMMQRVVARLQGRDDQDTPLGKAQALMYRAFEEPDEQRRVQLAQDAL